MTSKIRKYLKLIQKKFRSFESFKTDEVHQNNCKSNIWGLSKEIIVQSSYIHKF
jgi:hypothetical protein